MPEIKQVIDGIRKEIDKWKSQDEVFVQSKDEFSKALDRIRNSKDYIKKQISELRAKKQELKESYYS